MVTNYKKYIDTIKGEKVKVLEYKMSSEVVLGRNENIKFKEKGVIVKVSSGNENNGSYAISNFTPDAELENCVGVHFGHAIFEILYPPKNLLKHIVYSSVNSKDFIDSILRDYKITLAGMDIIPGTMGAKYLIAGK